MGTQLPSESFDSNMTQPGTGGSEPQECFVLKWSEYHMNVAESFKTMRADGDFLDTTVACSGSEQLQAHRVVLSAFSPYLKGMLRNNPQPNPVLIMPPTVKFIDLHSLLEFMYHGEVRVPADDLESLMQLAQLLRIKGLTEEKDGPEDNYRFKPDYQRGSSGPLPSSSNAVPSNKGDEPKSKRKRMTSTSTVASDIHDDDSRFSQPYSTSSSQATPQSYTGTSTNGFNENAHSIHPAAYDAMHPGGPSGGDGVSGSAIKLQGLICPQCRIMCHGVPALKEHMAASHGIINTPNNTPAQTPVKLPKQPMVDNVPPMVSQVWNAPKVHGNNEVNPEPEAFYCNICPKEKSKPFPSHQKLLSHQKRVHKEDDLDEEDLQQSHDDLAYEETIEMSSPSPNDASIMTAPVQRANQHSTPTPNNKRIGRGGSNRGRSPALGRTKKGTNMGRSDNVQGGRVELERVDRSESRHIESPRHRQVSNAIEIVDGMSTGSAKSDTHSMARPIGQVSPAPRHSSNSGVSKTQSGFAPISIS